MDNAKITIYPEEQIQNVIDFLTEERDIFEIVEVDGISTITVASTLLLLDENYTYLQAGHYIKIDNINYKVLSVIDNESFNIAATGLTGTKWSLALEFRYGSRIEINELLNLAIQDPTSQLSRFPLLWLIIDAEYSENQSFSYPIDFEKNMKFALVNLTEKEYTASQRLDNNFKPTLRPYYELLMNTLQSQYFSNVFLFEENFIDVRKYDRFFYGSATKNQMVLDSPTDAIEFDINFTFLRQYCD